MLDKFLIMPRQPAQHTHVTVKQQPNDAADAARLHGEIREKATAEARAEFIDALVESIGAGNSLRVVTAEQRLNIVTMTQEYVVVLDINGVRHVMRGEAYAIRKRAEDLAADVITGMVLRYLFNRKP